MKYRSTNNRSPQVSFREAVLSGLAPDGGLYLPLALPRIDRSTLPDLSFPALASLLAHELIGDEFASEELLNLCHDAFSFPLPFSYLDERTKILELFHGPTLAFKDFGARFLARILALITQDSPREKQITILTATSGDTGSAVAAGFHGVSGVRAFILYPEGRISAFQEEQIRSFDGNITPVAVQGNFDDCQRLVKSALGAGSAREDDLWTSANSINIARLLPQAFYYVYASLQSGKEDVVFSVPSGNFGNVTAGLIANQILGSRNIFVAATNANRTVPDYLQTGHYESRASIPTLSSAMDVGNPSNFSRVIDILDAGDRRELFTSYSVSDEETIAMIQRVHEERGILLDPHTAVGVSGLERYRSQHRDQSAGIVLATASPFKFRLELEEATGLRAKAPEGYLPLGENELKPVQSIAPDLRELSTLLSEHR